MRILVAAILSLLVLSPVDAFTRWTTVAKVVAPSLAHFRTYNNLNGKGGTCTAIIVDAAHGKAITAGHCIEASRPEIQGHYVMQMDDLPVTVERYQAVNDYNDIALLRFVPNRRYRSIKIVQHAPLLGAPVAIFGYPLWFSNLTMQAGHVSNPFDDKSKMIWSDLTTMAGDSGAAFVNLRGELVGMGEMSFAYDNSGALSAGVTAAQIRAFLK